MRQVRTVFFAAVAMLFIGLACTEDNDPVNTTGEFDPQTVKTILEAQAQFDDAFFVSEEAISSSSGRAASTLCADISLDTTTRNLVVDFGEGCTSPLGIERSGKMIINYVTFSLTEGIAYGLTFENFTVEGNTLNGTIDVSGFRRDDDDDLFFQVAIENGRVDYADGRTLTHSSIRTFTWEEGEGDDDDDSNVFEFTGSAEGTTVDGISYAMRFANPLVLKSECFNSGFAFAAAGIFELELSTLEDVVTVDFGDGSCDAEADWTYLDRSGTLNLRD